MGLRSLLWILIAALLLYGAWQGLRALAAGRAQKTGAPRAARESMAEAADDEKTGEAEDADDDAGFAYAPRPAPMPAPARPAAENEVFRLELEIQRLRRELDDMRGLLDGQRQETAALHSALNALRGQFEAAAASQSAAPQYSEALVFARRGLAADAIAERCDISVAEAELVRALAARGGEKDT